MDKETSSKLRGKSAIDAAHMGVSREDEARLDTRISQIYGVESDEATEIHANYHIEKILAILARRAEENGMKRQTLLDRAQHLNIAGAAHEIARGKMTEAAAVDVLFRGLSTIESGGKMDDRFNIYG